LLSIDPRDRLPISSLFQFYSYQAIHIDENEKLPEVLNLLRKGKSSIGSEFKMN
jgi:hypothetical protein